MTGMKLALGTLSRRDDPDPLGVCGSARGTASIELVKIFTSA
jgi:hypothetical protein